MDRNTDDGQRNRTHGHGHSMVISGREHELQKLLAEERLRSEQRKTNYSTLKSEHVKLQKDFLSLQSDMREILEETKIIKDKKDNELENTMKLIEEKEKIIGKLRAELKECDPKIIRDAYADELQEPIRRLQKENERIERGNERMTYELKMAKQKIEFLEKECVDSVERVKLTYDAEINLIRKEREEIRSKLMEANQLPDAQKLLQLTQENAKLNAKVKSFQNTVDDAEQQYRKIQKKVELLVMEHEKGESQVETQIGSVKLQLSNSMDENQMLREEIKSYKRRIEELLSEIKYLNNDNKRLKNDMEEKEKFFLSEKDKLKLSLLKEQKEMENEKEILCDELKKLKLDGDNKNMITQRLEHEINEKTKEFQLQIATVRQNEFEKRCAIEQDKVNLLSKLKEITDEKIKLKEEIEHLKRQNENSSELRMSIERELMILRAKSESFQTNIEELEKLRRQHITLHDELNKFKSDYAECNAQNKELIRQRERYRDDYNRIKEDLDDERKQINEFKVLSEKNLTRLRNCIEEERNEMRDKLLNIERDALKWKREKDDAKSKYKHYASIAEKLQNKLSDEKRQHQFQSQTPDTVPVELHRQLKKQYKSLKHKQNELSNLLNCSFDTPRCKEPEQT